jgi:hypothetical protein
MQVQVNTGGFDAFMSGIRRTVEKKWATAGQVAEESAQFGSKTAQAYTASRPGATTGKSGRVDTAAMITALRWKTNGSTGSTFRTSYGFVGDFKEYFRVQTVTGFRHNRSAAFIAPTFALRDSRGPVEAFARAQLRSRL